MDLARHYLTPVFRDMFSGGRSGVSLAGKGAGFRPCGGAGRRATSGTAPPTSTRQRLTIPRPAAGPLDMVLRADRSGRSYRCRRYRRSPPAPLLIEGGAGSGQLTQVAGWWETRRPAPGPLIVCPAGF